MLEIDRIHNIDCLKGMNYLPKESIDIVVTSPPYDNLRAYDFPSSVDLHRLGEGIFRVLRDGAVAIMVIQDQTITFAKSLTSFTTIVDWCNSFGFRLFETIIYRKYGTEGAWWKNRFRVDHEYMPIFLKGLRPQYFNKDQLLVPSKHAGEVLTGSGNRKTDGKMTKRVTRAINPMKCRGTIWDYLMAGDKDPLKQKHPATFPDQIPYDFIQCFCPPNGIVLDPLAGSGSTLVSAKRLGHHFIGFDINREYCDIAEQRLAKIPSILHPLSEVF